MDWHDSDPSDDETNQAQFEAAARKRSSRACDQCRKTKSKCERPGGNVTQCKSCGLAGIACTFLGPSYKRGPPKGYIHAIEQRWHQVESLLGAIIQCPDPRVQGIVSDLRQDGLAREIINRVDMGPYGPSGRRNQPAGATKEDFFASILKSSQPNSARDPSRSRRQSRVSREIVSSNQDNGLSVLPTQEWQDNLSNRLASSSPSNYASSSNVVFPESSIVVPPTQRRRLNSVPDDFTVKADWDNVYAFEDHVDNQEQQKDAADSIGALSLDEHQEVRFHGKASGLHILGRNLRTDDRIEGGIWKLPMARVWPPSKFRSSNFPDEGIDVPLPPIHVQDQLLDLYFTYVHPLFPLIRKDRFLAEYNLRKQGNTNYIKLASSNVTTSSRPEPSQELTPLLLLSIFALAARYREEEMPYPPKGKMWEAGSNYLETARDVLTLVFHRSRPSTVQSLLLLGFREFGIGSMEQGWNFLGMGIRMAVDLGLNCDPASWTLHGQKLFSAEEIQSRRQIWWACCLADRYGSVYMGRPTMIKEGDYDTHMPREEDVEDNFPWEPVASTRDVSYSPVPARVLCSFSAAASLSVIVGAIVTKIYPIRCTPGASRRAILANLETQLDQWYITLHESLRYDPSSKRVTPPPHILFLHVRYWGAVLLLHRAFIPNCKDPSVRNTMAESKAFDLAQGAASHVSAIVNVHRERFTLKQSPPFLTCYILSACIMHILTLTLRPSNVQASLGHRQCMIALKDMEVVWPSASRAWELLNGVKLEVESTCAPQYHGHDAHKRHAEDAFGREKSSDYLQREAFGTFDNKQVVPENEQGVQELSTRIMAHMLGLDIPGIEPSTSYYPGYEWWPRSNQELSPSLSPDGSTSGTMNALPTPSRPADDWLQSATGADAVPGYTYNFNQYGGL